MQPEFLLLEQLPQAAVLLRAGVVERRNPAARQLLPGLEEGRVVPEPLLAVLNGGGAGGLCTLEGRGWEVTLSRLEEWQLVLFRPARESGLDRGRLQGMLRQTRQILGQLMLDLGEEQPDGGRVAHSVYRMARLLENAQTVQAGEEQRFAPVMLDLAGLCREMALQAGDLLAQIGVELEVRQMPATALIPGDEALLQRMILELLANAAAAVGRGRVVLSLHKHPSCVVLSVTDSGNALEGLGLHEVLQPEPQGIPRPGAGAGLGLDVVRQVARLHGGSVLMTPGKGEKALVVGVSLPAGPLDPHAGVHAPAEQGGGLSPVLLGLAEVLSSGVYSREDLE